MDRDTIREITRANSVAVKDTMREMALVWLVARADGLIWVFGDTKFFDDIPEELQPILAKARAGVAKAWCYPLPETLPTLPAIQPPEPWPAPDEPKPSPALPAGKR